MNVQPRKGDTDHPQVRVHLLGMYGMVVTHEVDRALAGLLRTLNNRLRMFTDFSCQGGCVMAGWDKAPGYFPARDWAYVSFVRSSDARRLFDLICEDVRYVQYEGRKEHGGGCVRFMPNELRTVVRTINREADQAEIAYSGRTR